MRDVRAQEREDLRQEVAELVAHNANLATRLEAARARERSMLTELQRTVTELAAMSATPSPPPAPLRPSQSPFEIQDSYQLQFQPVPQPLPYVGSMASIHLEEFEQGTPQAIAMANHQGLKLV